tara:strand:- start:1373 stop:1672 length:300 start_codon:yes stop_codon:yes gene_type:complete
MDYESLKKQIRDKRLGLNKDSMSSQEKSVEDDEYRIDEIFQKIKFLIDKTEPRLYKFMFKGTVDASIDSRNNLNEIRKLCVELRSNILKQRQDNQSDYS